MAYHLFYQNFKNHVRLGLKIWIQIPIENGLLMLKLFFILKVCLIE